MREKDDTHMAKVLTEDEARCIASANRQPYCWRSLSETFGSLFSVSLG